MCKVMTAVVVALCMLAAAAAARPSAEERPIIMAQGGFTFGSRDDLGPRYDPIRSGGVRSCPRTPARVVGWLCVRLCPLAR
jgi:hypothetical protein